jgi:hypothetical protein
MIKTDVQSILLANSYYIQCKKRGCEKSELARKYLTVKIRKALSERKKSNKASILNLILFIILYFHL